MKIALLDGSGLGRITDTLNYVVNQTMMIGEDVSQNRNEDVSGTDQNMDESDEYLLETKTVRSSKNVDGLTITLERAEFFEDEHVIYLTIKNNTTTQVFLFRFDCIGIQGRKQFGATRASLKTKIPPSIDEIGWISFRPLDHNMASNTKFRLEFQGIVPYQNTVLEFTME